MRKPTGFTVVLALACGIRVSAAMADPCDMALQHVRPDWQAGRLQDVIGGLRPFEAECVANPQFDRILGEALLASGQPEEALMPLERALALTPGDQATLRALSQAWRVLGDAVATLKARQSMAAGQSGPDSQFHWRMTVETGAGHDSNAMQAPCESNITIPALGNARFTLSPEAMPHADAYRTSMLRTEGQLAVMPGTTLLLSGAYSMRRYDELAKASTSSHQASVKLRTSTPAWGVWSTEVQSDRLKQGDTLNRVSTGGSLEWQPRTAFSWQPALSWHVARYNYSSATGISDAGFSLQQLGLSANRMAGRLALGINLIAGYEKAAQHSTDGNRNMTTLRLLGGGPLSSDASWYAWTDFTHSRYSEQDRTFLATREDWLDAVGAGLSWRLWQGVSVRSQLVLSRQDSSIPLHTYQRTEFLVLLGLELGK